MTLTTEMRMLLRMFRDGNDTKAIAEKIGMRECQVEAALHRALDLERREKEK